jgi:hypothetical protein
VTDGRAAGRADGADGQRDDPHHAGHEDEGHDTLEVAVEVVQSHWSGNAGVWGWGSNFTKQSGRLLTKNRNLRLFEYLTRY